MTHLPQLLPQLLHPLRWRRRPPRPHPRRRVPGGRRNARPALPLPGLLGRLRQRRHAPAAVLLVARLHRVLLLQLPGQLLVQQQLLPPRMGTDVLLLLHAADRPLTLLPFRADSHARTHARTYHQHASHPVDEEGQRLLEGCEHAGELVEAERGHLCRGA